MAMDIKRNHKDEGERIARPNKGAIATHEKEVSHLCLLLPMRCLRAHLGQKAQHTHQNNQNEKALKANEHGK